MGMSAHIGAHMRAHTGTHMSAHMRFSNWHPYRCLYGQKGLVRKKFCFQQFPKFVFELSDFL